MQTLESALWDEWKKVTRFLEGSRIAFHRELMICSSFETEDQHTTRLTTKFGMSTFQISLAEYLKAIGDESVLFSVVLTSAYTLTESFARIKLNLSEEEPLPGGIEGWGSKLLNRTGHGWNDVLGGKAGLMEVSIARNAFSHGIKEANDLMVSRFTSLGLESPWQNGDAITLNYESLEEYREGSKV